MIYSHLVKKLDLNINNKHEDDRLAHITHYMHNYGEPAADYFVDEALKHLPKDLNPNDIEWDIPFPKKDNPKFTFIDLFAGIGGTRLAFENLGGKCVFSSEIDLYAKKTYHFNYGEIPFGDITKINEKAIPEHDILVGGFPCQAFSIAGRRGGFDDTRGTLFFDIARIIKEKKPKAFFLENVKGLLNHDKGKTINVILNTLRNDLGYFVPDPKIVNASDFGVPQNRERVYIVGFRGDLNVNDFKYPSPIDFNISFSDIKEENEVSVKYYLSDTYLETLRQHRYRHASAGNGFGYEVIDDEGIANAIVTGGMGRERNLVVDKRLKNFTPVTHIKGKVNREGIRRMTPREWARLQGFPDEFVIKVSDAQAYKQFGNSVAIPAVQATGEKLISILFEEKSFDTTTTTQTKTIIKNENVLDEKHNSKGEMMNVLKYNKGEWSEVYTVIKLLSDGGIYAGDSDLNRIEEYYYPLIKILRTELLDSTVTNYEYIYNENEIEIPDDVNIRIINGDTNDLLLELPVADFKDKALKLLNDINQGQGRSFAVSDEVESFLNSIYVTKMNAKSNVKRDITLVVHDLITGFRPKLGFSIKSKLGNAPTLLNASRATNFTYKIIGDTLLVNDEVERINNTFSSTYERILELERLGYTMEFDDVDNDIFKSNLQLIDTSFPFIISELLKYYYKRETRNTMLNMINKIESINPCGFNMNKEHPFYSYKMKKFLVDAALGMMPNSVWQGVYDANGGYIVVKKDGDLVCYHVYNQNEFQDYLFKNTRFEAAARNRNDYGYIYKDGEDTFMKLNLQIRFM